MKLKHWLLTLPLIAFAFLVLLSAGKKSTDPPLVNKKEVMTRGEQVHYRVHYGWITAGVATMKITPDLYKVNDKICYRMEVVGKTTGAFDKMLRIRDTWGTYFDTAEAYPQKSYRIIEEGRYRRLEEIYFDHNAKKGRMEVINEKRKVDFDIPKGVQDMVSGYYYLRLVDYNALKPGDLLGMDATLEDKTYSFKVKYVGKEKLKTDLGKIEALVLSPIMPKNDLFDGENSIKFYISNDQNRIPLKIKAELFVGAVELDITSADNLKVPLKTL